MSALFRKCGLLAVAVLLPLLLSGCPKYALTVQVTGQGSVAVDPAGGPYKKNSSVTLTPAPAAGWHVAFLGRPLHAFPDVADHPVPQPDGATQASPAKVWLGKVITNPQGRNTHWATLSGLV